MRDYQTKSNVGGVPDSITITKLGAGEANSVLTENENAVKRAGLTLAPADGTGEDTTQLAQSLFIHAVKAQQFQDGGSANTYELTPISGSSGVLLPGGYGTLDGARIWFKPGAANTGPSTVNIGQTSGTLLGAKALLTAGGAALSGGELQANVDVEVIYSSSADGGSGGWLLASANSEATETTRGIVEKATAAEAQAFTADKFLDGARLASAFMGGNQNMGSTGSQTFPGGLIVKWGIVGNSGSLAAPGDNSTVPVVFDDPFPGAVYAAIVCENSFVIKAAQNNISVSGFDVRYTNVGPSGGGSSSAFYIAIGN